MQFAPNAENNERAMLKRMEHEAHALFSKTGSHRTAHTLFWHTFALVSPDMPPIYLVISIVFRAGKCNTILLQLRLFSPLFMPKNLVYWIIFMARFCMYFRNIFSKKKSLKTVIISKILFAAWKSFSQKSNKALFSLTLLGTWTRIVHCHELRE